MSRRREGWLRVKYWKVPSKHSSTQPFLERERRSIHVTSRKSCASQLHTPRGCLDTSATNQIIIASPSPAGVSLGQPQRPSVDRGSRLSFAVVTGDWSQVSGTNIGGVRKRGRCDVSGTDNNVQKSFLLSEKQSLGIRRTEQIFLEISVPFCDSVPLTRVYRYKVEPFSKKPEAHVFDWLNSAPTGRNPYKRRYGIDATRDSITTVWTPYPRCDGTRPMARLFSSTASWNTVALSCPLLPS